MFKKILLFDKTLFSIVLLLCLLGVGTILISSYHISLKNKGFPYYYAYNHVFSLLIGWGFLLGMILIPLGKLKKFSILFFLLSFILCIMVFVPNIGKKVSGANRWIKLMSISFQPSEIVKLGLIFCLSYMMVMKKDHLHVFKRSFIPFFSVLMLTTLIIALEPDFSTALIVFLMGFFFFFINRIRLTYLFLILAIVFPFFIYFVEYKKYLLNRFVFIMPNIDPYGKGYHIIQSLKSFKLGGLRGMDSEKMFYLNVYFPDIHTDFTFSLLARIGGLLLIFFILGLFIILIIKSFMITLQQEDFFKKNLGMGISILFSLEIILHILVNIGLSPTTGSILPFISYGGTSLFIHLIMVGILLNLSIKEEKTLPLKSNLC
jgi:cell division protein FtsW (lipid II flippase)